MSIIDGSSVALAVKNKASEKVREIASIYGVVPGIATIIVGEDSASLIYVNRKYKEATKIGIKAEIVRLPLLTAQQDLISVIEGLNARSDIHAILLQLPLPEHIDKFVAINTIDPKKDVDGLTFVNAGKVSVGRSDCIFPCTPQGCIELVKSLNIDFVGKNAVVVGRSNLVGKPLADMLLYLGCTVSIAHKETSDLACFTRQADLLFVATGVSRLITGSMLKQGSVVIDIGISRLGDKIVGDCDFESCREVAGFISPVPGGVGPMTIAYLLYNTVACCLGFCGKN